MEQVYKTKDLAEASYLLAMKIELKTIERVSGVCWFVFRDLEKCHILVHAFWFGSESVIHAKSYFECIQTLKRKIFI